MESNLEQNILWNRSVITPTVSQLSHQQTWREWRKCFWIELEQWSDKRWSAWAREFQRWTRHILPGTAAVTQNTESAPPKYLTMSYDWLSTDINPLIISANRLQTIDKKGPCHSPPKWLDGINIFSQTWKNAQKKDRFNIRNHTWGSHKAKSKIECIPIAKRTKLRN